MNLSTVPRDRQQAEEPWDWIFEIRLMLLARIEALSIACEDSRELTDVAALLAHVNKMIDVRYDNSVDHREGFRGMLRRPSTVATAAGPRRLRR